MATLSDEVETVTETPAADLASMKKNAAILEAPRREGA